MSVFSYCNATFPCPVCGRRDECRVTDQGLHFCHDLTCEDDRPAGFRWHGLSQGGSGTWGMWWRDGDGEGREPGHRRCRDSTPHAPAPRGSPGFAHALEHQERTSHAQAVHLAALLGLPQEAVERHWHYLEHDLSGRECWTIPETTVLEDGTLRTASIHHRYPDGTKRSHGNPDSPTGRGLTLLSCQDERPGPVFCPEGPSDSCAGWSMGLCTVGRPNNEGGIPALARYLSRPEMEGRDVIVLAERDRHRDAAGRMIWPGYNGAVATARELAERLGRPVRVALPPEGVKDLREWFVARWDGHGNPRSLQDAFGREWLGCLEVFRPGQRHAALDEITADAFPDEAAGTPPLPAPAQGGDGAEEDASHRRQRQALAEHLREVLQDAARDREEDAGKFRAVVAGCIATMRARQDAYHCPRCRPIHLRDRGTNAQYVVYRRCEAWCCPGCRCYMVERELYSAGYHFAAAPALFELGCTGAQWPTVQRRIRRAGAQYFRCRDGEGWYVVCSARVAGSIPVTASQALSTADTLLHDWRDDHRPVSTSHGWGLLEEEEGDLETVGPCAPDLTPQGVQEIAQAMDAQAQLQGSGDERPRRSQQVWRLVRPAGWDEQSARDLAMSLSLGFPVTDLDGFPGACMAAPEVAADGPF